MRALTLWRPYDFAILHAGKDVENRGWKPPTTLPVGARLAIHAGARYDYDGTQNMIRLGLVNVAQLSGTEAHPSSIMGVATYLGWFQLARNGQVITNGAIEHADARARSPWFARGDAIGWMLGDALALPQPIPCAGKQGLWTVPDFELAHMREQIEGL